MKRVAWIDVLAVTVIVAIVIVVVILMVTQPNSSSPPSTAVNRGARANPERDDYIRAAARRVVQRLTSMGRADAYLNV